MKNRDFLQQEYFDALRDYLGCSNNAELVKRLIPVLGRSSSVLYSRLNGERKLSHSEGLRIGQQLGFWGRDFVEGKLQSGVSVRGSLDRPEEVVNEVHNVRISGDVLHYATTELPVFYVMGFPNLFAVKRHLWKYYTFGQEQGFLPPLEETPNNDITEIYQSVYQDYLGIPRSETWGESILDNLLSQIRYLVDMGALSPFEPIFEVLEGEVRELMQQLRIMVNHQEHPLQVYANRFHYASNFILREGAQQRAVYIPGKNMNFYRYDQAYVYQNHQHDWELQIGFMDQLMEVSKREQAQFFQRLNRRVRRELETIKSDNS